MEAATKKGRPKKFDSVFYAIGHEEKRVKQNRYYTGLTVIHLSDIERDPFFVTSNGNFRRAGIAEQIGRMYEDGTITEDQARDLIKHCKEEYQDGRSVKDIEQTLRTLHRTLK